MKLRLVNRRNREASAAVEDLPRRPEQRLRLRRRSAAANCLSASLPTQLMPALACRRMRIRRWRPCGAIARRLRRLRIYARRQSGGCACGGWVGARACRCRTSALPRCGCCSTRILCRSAVPDLFPQGIEFGSVAQPRCSCCTAHLCYRVITVLW